MSSLDAIVPMGPPGSGKSFLGNRLKLHGIVAYVELEPILVDTFGTGPEFASNKARAVAFIRDCYREQLAHRSNVIAFESTGVTDRPLLEEIQRCHNVALVKFVTPKPICLQRIASRPSGKNLSNHIAASERFYDYWYSEVEPTYSFALAVDGEDAEQACRVILQFLQGVS
jgi:hypothetical protein